MYLYRAVENSGDIIEFRFRQRCKLTAAKRFLRKVLEQLTRPVLGSLAFLQYQSGFATKLSNLIG